MRAALRCSGLRGALSRLWSLGGVPCLVRPLVNKPGIATPPPCIILDLALRRAAARTLTMLAGGRGDEQPLPLTAPLIIQCVRVASAARPGANREPSAGHGDHRYSGQCMLSRPGPGVDDRNSAFVSRLSVPSAIAFGGATAKRSWILCLPLRYWRLEPSRIQSPGDKGAADMEYQVCFSRLQTAGTTDISYPFFLVDYVPASPGGCHRDEFLEPAGRAGSS